MGLDTRQWNGAVDVILRNLFSKDWSGAFFLRDSTLVTPVGDTRTNTLHPDDNLYCQPWAQQNVSEIFSPYTYLFFMMRAELYLFCLLSLSVSLSRSLVYIVLSQKRQVFVFKHVRLVPPCGFDNFYDQFNKQPYILFCFVLFWSFFIFGGGLHFLENYRTPGNGCNLN